MPLQDGLVEEELLVADIEGSVCVYVYLMLLMLLMVRRWCGCSGLLFSNFSTLLDSLDSLDVLFVGFLCNKDNKLTCE